VVDTTIILFKQAYEYMRLYRIKLNVTDEAYIFKGNKDLSMALKGDIEVLDLRR
jgi:hypothetical protein